MSLGIACTDLDRAGRRRSRKKVEDADEIDRPDGLSFGIHIVGSFRSRGGLPGHRGSERRVEAPRVKPPRQIQNRFGHYIPPCPVASSLVFYRRVRQIASMNWEMLAALGQSAAAGIPSLIYLAVPMRTRNLFTRSVGGKFNFTATFRTEVLEVC